MPRDFVNALIKDELIVKDFKEEENNDEACHYHPGEPIFHDIKKFWTCCKAESYDWDDFMKLPTCAVGKH